MFAELNSDDRSGIPSSILNAQFGAWLGGCLEVTGSLYFVEGKTVQKGKTYYYPRPTLALVDDNYDRMAKLPKIVGIDLTKGTHNHWLWRTSGAKAATLALLAERFTPSRQEMMLAIHNWEVADSDERLQISREMKGDERISNVQTGVYERLLSNPYFLAGAIDLKSYLKNRRHSVKGHDYAGIEIILRSRNRPLLEVLTNHFGGAVNVQHQGNTQREINGEGVLFQRESFEWRSEAKKVRDLLKVVKDTSLLRKEEIQELLTLVS